MAAIERIANESPSNDTQYFTYTHSTSTTIGELKKYINSYGYSIMDSVDLYNQASNDIPSHQIPTDAVVLDLSDNTYVGTNTGPTSDYESDLAAVSDYTVANYNKAIVIQHSNDYHKLMNRKYELLKNNTMTAYNQETALKYIFCFFLVISLYTFGVNFNKLNLTHIIIYIFFVIYIFYHTSVSNYLLSNFKIAFYELKVAGTASQIITYLKIMFFMLLTFFMPLVVFSSVSDEPFIPFMAATDNLTPSEALESTSNILEDTLENVTDVAKETAESTTNAFNDATASIGESTKSATDGIGESLNNAVENIKESVIPEKRGGSRRMKGGKKN